jgi:hypothetical protein
LSIPELEQHLTALEGPRLADRSLPVLRSRTLLGEIALNRWL